MMRRFVLVGRPGGVCPQIEGFLMVHVQTRCLPDNRAHEIAESSKLGFEILKVIRCSIGSQCKCFKIGVICSHLRRMVTMRASVF